MLPEDRRYCAGTLAVLAFAFTLFCALTAAKARTQGVCSVPGDYATIQAAVDDAACETVNVGAGTFYESVTISRTVTLQGQGEDLTIVDGNNDGVIFHIQDSGVVTLTGMTLQNLQAGFGSAILNNGVALVGLTIGCTPSTTRTLRITLTETLAATLTVAHNAPGSPAWMRSVAFTRP